MLITVTVFLKQKYADIQRVNDTKYIIKVKSGAEENQANLEAVKLISTQLGIDAKHITLVRGAKAKTKQFFVEDDEEE